MWWSGTCYQGGSTTGLGVRVGSDSAAGLTVSDPGGSTAGLGVRGGSHSAAGLPVSERGCAWGDGGPDLSSQFYLKGRESDLELGFASLFGDWRLDSPPNSLDFSRQRHREPPSASLSSRDQDILIRRQASRMESGGVGTKSHVCVLCRNDVSAVACDGRGGMSSIRVKWQKLAEVTMITE
ncbi:uncharacterized protein [Branchiostoma lanceolatum]|uniref:uncharacterized protein n=1 Tax=Branchiostoma lanceolatum TaxID=7740 RepID=UPI0034550514